MLIFVGKKNRHTMMKACIALFAWLLSSSAVMAQQREVTLETTEGTIRLTLYNDTPAHRDNFVKLVEQHFYDSLLFHRVIRGFMIQSGDPTSRHAEPGQTLGEGEAGYTLPAELFASDGTLLHHHGRGALAMAREGDEVNPERRSSGSQFYIVWGRNYSTKEMEHITARLDSLTSGRASLSEQQVRAYRREGGAPHLDGLYTVFGHVTEGLDVVERIQRAFTDDYDRPVDDVRILRATVR